MKKYHRVIWQEFWIIHDSPKNPYIGLTIHLTGCLPSSFIFKICENLIDLNSFWIALFRLLKLLRLKRLIDNYIKGDHS